jgi:hypothetical protein
MGTAHTAKRFLNKNKTFPKRFPDVSGKRSRNVFRTKKTFPKRFRYVSGTFPLEICKNAGNVVETFFCWISRFVTHHIPFREACVTRIHIDVVLLCVRLALNSRVFYSMFAGLLVERVAVDNFTRNPDSESARELF